MTERQSVAAEHMAQPEGAGFSCERYLFPGWKTSIAAILGGMALSFVLFGLFYPFWWFSDQDLILAYQGLLLNAGLPQEYFDHTGYLYDLVIAGWYSLLHWLGLLPVHSLSELPSLKDVPAFTDAWQHLVVAGRLLSLLLAGFFVWLYATQVRRLVGDWRVAVLAAMALSLSGAVIMHMRVMRTELLSGGLAVGALLLILLAACDVRLRSWRPVLLGLAALAATLAIVTKVQAVLLVVTLPAIALAFGRYEPKDDQRPRASAWIAAAWIVAALLAAMPAARLFLQGLAYFPGEIFAYRRLGFVPDGVYQACIALWVVVAMATYCRLWRIRSADCAAGVGAVLLGVSMGLLSLTLRFHPENLIAVTHPIEHLFYFATWSTKALADQTQVLNGTLFEKFFAGFGRALLAHDYEPVFLLELFAIVGAVVAWRRGDRLLPLQVLMLVVVVLGLDAAFTLRHVAIAYFVYTDPLLILAAALVAVRFPEWQQWAWKRKATLAIVVFCILWGNHPPVRQLLFATHDPKLACEWLPSYLSRIGPFPYCGSD